MVNDYFKLKAPLCVGILTTNKCNLKCKHCMNNAGEGTAIKDLSKEMVKGIIDDCENSEVYFIEFNGGEFFTRNDRDELLDYAVTKNMKIGITTNGTLIDDAWIQKYRNKIYLMRISLDSHIGAVHDNFRGVHGAFSKTVNNIKKLLKNNYKVTILHTVTKSSAKTFGEYINFLDSIGVHGVHTTILIPAGRGKGINDEVMSPIEHKNFLIKYRKIKENLKKTNSKLKILEESPQAFLLDERINKNIIVKCGAAFTEVVVTTEGFVLPCAAFISTSEKYKIDELSIYKNNIIDIYRNSTLMNNMRNVNLIKGQCSSCEYLKNCGGGCRATADIVTGDVMNSDPMCWIVYNETDKKNNN